MNNVLLIIIAIAIFTVVVYGAYVFINMPKNTQIRQVQEWLLYAVAKAEKELGSGTGQLKLRYVYDMFIARFPHLANFIGFVAFSGLVDEALDVFKEMLQQNVDVNKYIGVNVDKEDNANG